MRAALVASLGALAAAWEGGPRSAACAVAADACPATAHAGLAALRCGTSYYPDAYSFATNATQTRLRDAEVRARVCARPPTRAAPRPDLSLGKFFYYGVAWRRVPFQSTPSILARACRVARDLGATVCSGSPITGDAPASFSTRVRRDVRRGRPSRALPWESAPGCCTRADGETRPRTGHRQEGARRHPPLLGGAVRRPASVSGSSPAPSTRLPRRPFQHTRPELAAWRFLPRGGCGATQDDWFAPPACAGVVDPPRGTVENDVDLPPGLWRLAAGVRHRLAGAGPCAATARDQLLGPLRRAAGRGLTAGVHVRRGDACERFGDEGDPTLRACYPAGAYAAALRRMRRTYGVQRVAVATDSPTVVGVVPRPLFLLFSLPRSSSTRSPSR